MKSVKEIMTKTIKVCAPHDTVTSAAKIMRDIECGSVPVCEGKKVVGIITDRDIVIQAVAEGKDTNSVHCHDCMTTDVVTCSPNTDIHECAQMMAQYQIRRIPVTENGDILGVVAIGDLAKENIYLNEAGYALSEISEHSRFDH
ncbi:CBS domain-containing protein [Lysinibacillus yapensis]|uniref:CBS domain-containing protein n=1 Tax=Ureibacillus yapensis TaxID=2304605 RepID=A0A396SB54_9BACL|nr:CBS domain-containing protein [Lysinibacillus yapensis]RHW38260.1 CBS domain-containing protein [Lysinibacillus yapensis]